MGRNSDRSTADLMVLIIATTICVAILLALIGVFTLQLAEPKVDLTHLVGNLNDVINTMIGLMAGYLAGRTERSRLRNRDEDDE